MSLLHPGDKGDESHNLLCDKLDEWARTKEAGDLAMSMSNETSEIENFLRQSSIDEDRYSLFVSVVDKAVCNQPPQAPATRTVLELICKTPFLDKHLTAFVLDRMTQDAWHDGQVFMNAMTRISEHVLVTVPSQAIKIITALPHLKLISEFFNFKDLTPKLVGIGVKANQVYKASKEKSRSRWGQCPTVETPPDNYVEVSVLPTRDDIKEEAGQPFVRPVIVEGGYEDKKHYLDTQFRLLRQDFIIPLRRGITEFKKSGFKRHFTSPDLRLYHDVRILGFVRRDDIDHVLVFDTSKLKSVRWDFSKRLIFGSLVCLSKDGFETMAFATITNRDPNDLKKGYVNVNFRSNLHLVFNSTPDDIYVMAETVAYYESYCHVLEGLQEMSEHLPLEEHIVACEKTVKPPKYLLNRSGCPSYNLYPLMKDGRKDGSSVNVPPLTTTKWPPLDKMSLNESQREAVKLALTKRLAVIHGPPGTGKTHVGLKVVHTLLENQNVCLLSKTAGAGHSPILIVCYTNHALDQFLEGILQFCAEGIVRVGGRSKTESLEPYNLSVIKKDKRNSQTSADWSASDSRKRCYIKVVDLTRQLEAISKKMDSTAFAICNVNELSHHMNEDHLESLRKGDESEYTIKGSVLRQWLNTRTEEPSESVVKIIESAMTKRILRVKPHHIKVEVTEEMPVNERAALYMFYVRKLEMLIQKEINQMQPNRHHQHIYKKLENHYKVLDTCRKNILSDKDINLVLTQKTFYKMRTVLYSNTHVKAWLLGLHNNHHAQLDDIEELQRAARSLDKENPDDIQSDDINQTLEAAIHADNESDLNYFLKTNALRNGTPAVIRRISSLNLDEEDDDSSNSGEERWKVVGKPLSFAKVKHKIKSAKPMTEEQERSVNDVWKLSMHDRFALYKLWLERYKSELADKMTALVIDYKSVLAEKKELNNQEIVSILQDAKVIGMTTTGAAKYRSVLQTVGCRIIVVEEAAEVLEAHIVTTLNRHCEQLILIGDHQQLRPNPNVYELAKNYGLDVSLFERLVKNHFPHVVLQEQHRMRPEISKIMRHIYPDLKDHPAVTSYDHIQGVAKDVFFVQHEEPESSVGDTHSRANTFEALYVIKLFEYLLLQGYEPSQVTILTTYAGQVLAIKTYMKTLKSKTSVRVTPVDNFQGEENDIIILSLVRSNEENNIGFLKVENRVCVALSRAKKGLFVIGNFELLSTQSKLWRKILRTAKAEGIFGNGLPVVCQNHPEKEPVLLFYSKDFNNRPEGGCGLPCTYILLCGHMCGLTCHPYDPRHKTYRCKKQCARSCILGHPCKKKCFEYCDKCLVPVPKTIPKCGHEDLVPCHLPPDQAKCGQPCEKILDSCEHQCSGKCGQCEELGKHQLCHKPVEYLWPCGHVGKVKCHQKAENNPCPHPCAAPLECGHLCTGTCGSCLQGQIHIACGEKCEKKLPCGHYCSSYCGAPCKPCLKPCPSKCRHHICGHSDKDSTQKCGHVCIPCYEKCIRGCPCNKCDKLCSEMCCHQLCEKPCEKKLKCGHTCSGICGEICVCGTCTKVQFLEKKAAELEIFKGNKRGNNFSQQDARRLLVIPTCGHVFFLDDIDKYVHNYDPDGSSYIPCPSCQKPIQDCTRYEHINQVKSKKRNQMKRLLIEDTECLTMYKYALEKSKRVLESSDLTTALKTINVNSVKSDAEMLAVSFKLKLTYVLTEINSFAPNVDENLEFTSMISSRKDAILKIGCHVTAQQMHEFVNDLTCCLWQSVFNKVVAVLLKKRKNVTASLSDLMREYNTSKDTEGRLEKRVESTACKMNDFFSECVMHLQPSDVKVAMQLKLIEKHANNAVEVLRSDIRKFLSEIIRPSKLPAKKTNAHLSVFEKRRLRLLRENRARQVPRTTSSIRHYRVAATGNIL